MTIALHDKNKYRGTLKVYAFHREQIEAMSKAAWNKVPGGMSYERALGYVKMLVLLQELDELKQKGHFEFDGPLPREPVDIWRSYDENGDWYEKKYSQGEMAPIQ